MTYRAVLARPRPAAGGRREFGALKRDAEALVRSLPDGYANLTSIN
jgi:hypothetical protein